MELENQVVVGNDQQQKQVQQQAPAFSLACNVKYLKQIVKTLEPFTNEFKLECGTNGIRINVVDSCNVGMIDMELSKESFITYSLQQSIALGIDLDKLICFLKLATPKDVISMTYDYNTNRLILRVGNLTRTMSLLDTKEMATHNVPAVNLPIKSILNTKEIMDVIKGIADISDHFSVGTNNDNVLTFYGENDTDCVVNKFPIDVQGEAISLFSIDYFIHMLKGVYSVSKTMILHIGTDQPCKIECTSGTDKITYMLAMRIEAE
jgi:DNA polymerase III sliding clamp (beta) subunit (PCNA family)